MNNTTEETLLPLVLPLARVTPAQAALVGGKAATLARLLRAGLPVPAGWCLTTAAYRRFIAACPEAAALGAQLAALPADQPDAQRALAGALRARLAATPLPTEVEAALLRAWEASGTGVAYAIRSSALAEDLPGATFAGQQESFLQVRGRAALLARVRDCWLSLFTDRAVAYRAAHGIDHVHTAMAVLVQVMVPAEVSGVLFTADPVTGSRRRLTVEGSYGLGEGLVSGRVTPDRVILARRGMQVVERQIAEKTVMIAPAVGEGTCEQPLSSEQAAASSLTDPLARRLGRLALKIERLLGGPQDIEWAAAHGKIAILQARPITTGLSAEDRRIWSNVNVGELLPTVVTPMSWSVVDRLVKMLFNPIVSRFDIDLEKDPVFGVVAGRVYANVGSFARLMRNLPGPSRMDLTQVFGGAQGPLTSEAIAMTLEEEGGTLLHSLRLLWRLPGLLLWTLRHASEKEARAYLAQMHDSLTRLLQTDVTALPEEELLPRFENTIRGCFAYVNGLAFAGVGMGSVQAFMQLCRRWFGNEGEAIANRLLASTNEMDSAEAALALWRLAAWVRAHSAVAEIVQQGRTVAAVRAQATGAEGQEFLARWDAYLARHGHHAQGELDIYRPRWWDLPDEVLAMLRHYLAGMASVDVLTHRQQQAEEWERRYQACRRRLRNPLARWLFTVLLRRSRRGLVIRENFKSEAIRLVAGLRRLLQELGARLARRGVLEEGDGLFFLALAELEPVRRGEAPFDVKATIAARRAEYRANLALSPPPVMIGRFDPRQQVTETGAPVAEMHGLAVSPGVVSGPARVMRQVDSPEKVLPGEILVAPCTDPGWTPHFLTAAGIVMDMGGLLSHGSIVAREYGIPTVVNVGPATHHLRTGQMLRVDGNRGVVTVLEP